MTWVQRIESDTMARVGDISLSDGQRAMLFDSAVTKLGEMGIQVDETLMPSKDLRGLIRSLIFTAAEGDLKKFEVLKPSPKSALYRLVDPEAGYSLRTQGSNRTGESWSSGTPRYFVINGTKYDAFMDGLAKAALDAFQKREDVTKADYVLSDPEPQIRQLQAESLEKSRLKRWGDQKTLYQKRGKNVRDSGVKSGIRSDNKVAAEKFKETLTALVGDQHIEIPEARTLTLVDLANNLPRYPSSEELRKSFKEGGIIDHDIAALKKDTITLGRMDVEKLAVFCAEDSARYGVATLLPDNYAQLMGIPPQNAFFSFALVCGKANLSTPAFREKLRATKPPRMDEAQWAEVVDTFKVQPGKDTRASHYLLPSMVKIVLAQQGKPVPADIEQAFQDMAPIVIDQAKKEELSGASPQQPNESGVSVDTFKTGAVAAGHALGGTISDPRRRLGGGDAAE